MANSPQALKRARQNDSRRLHKASQKTLLRTNIKKVKNAVASQTHDAATLKDLFTNTQSSIDKANFIHPNKAARLKSRLNKSIKLAASATATTETPKKKRSKSSKA